MRNFIGSCILSIFLYIPVKRDRDELIEVLKEKVEDLDPHIFFFHDFENHNIIVKSHQDTLKIKFFQKSGINWDKILPVIRNQLDNIPESPAA